ncbi:hypothetical protein, partial [Pullulanibacillus pueri]|uniref:hypothetical protein n=1 Tax=Pullulanibacillus pueri TaxID=1437324 RepID=UPI00195A61A5
TARVRRSILEHHSSIPKLAEAVPEESERSGVKIHTVLLAKNFILSFLLRKNDLRSFKNSEVVTP